MEKNQPSNRLPTGMIKRANPLTLKPTEEATLVTKKVTKKSQPKANPTKSSPVVLTGAKQWFFILPLLNKELVRSIKNAFPGLSNQAIVEKALLTLLKEARPNAYDSLIKSMKK
jgi:hypothetical protein